MKKFIVLVLIFHLHLATAQNLVTNGDFETHGAIPCGQIINAGDFAAAVPNWNSPTDGTPDFYSSLAPDSCSNHQPVTTFVSSFGSYIGTQAAQSGNSFVGIHTLIPGAHYREYLQGQLSQPVNIGDTLLVSLYVSMAEGSQYATNNMGVDFSTSSKYVATVDALGTVPLINFTQVITDTANWVFLSDTIVATSAWQYFVIGNFYDDAHTTAVQFNLAGDRGTAYYYIDNVSVVKLGANNNEPKARFSTDTVLCAGNCVTFNNLSTFATSYKWIFPGGSPATSIDNTPTACYNAAGKYDVELIATGGKSDTLLLKNYITVNPLPVAGIVTSSKNIICANTGLTSKLIVTGYSGSIQWQSSTGGNNFVDIPLADSSIYTTSRTLQQTTKYRATVSNSCGTDTTNSATVTIVPSPVAAFTYAINNKQVVFNSAGSSKDVVIYNWDFGDGETSTDANPTHLYTTSAKYYVCLTVYNGSNCSFTFCQYVDLLDNGIVQLQETVFLCPNPVAGDQLTVVIKDATTFTNAKIHVTDVLGRRLISTIPAGGQTILNVEYLPAGAYFLSLQSGNDVVIRKFIKQ